MNYPAASSGELDPTEINYYRCGILLPVALTYKYEKFIIQIMNKQWLIKIKSNVLSKKTELLIFAMLFLAGVAFYHPVEYDNTTSRYFLLSAVVDYGTLNIDVYRMGTIDKAEWNGHYYSNKAPGAPLLGLPVYWCLRYLTPLRFYAPLGPLDMYIVRVVTTTLLFALLGVVMYSLASFCGASSRQAFLMVVAYGFGSIALLHAMLFSGHQIAASLSFFSFALLVRLSGDGRTVAARHWGYVFLAGLLAGLAVITDYTAIVIAAGLTVYVAASRMGVRLKFWFLSGGFAWALILTAYNMVCFGSPFSSSYEHLTFDQFREGAAQGILGIGVPSLRAMVGLLLSPSRGVFFIMPVLLLSLWGIARMIGREKRPREAVLIAAVAIGSFLFIAGFYGWHGGWTFGPRYLVPMLPFLAFPIAFLRWRPYIFWLLFVPSCAQIVLSAIGVPHVPEHIVNPIVEFIVPCMGHGYTALNAGMLLSLAWPWSVTAVVVLVGLFGVWAFRESGRDKPPLCYDRVPVLSVAVLIIWIVMIVAALAMMRTDQPAMVHHLRSRVLVDAAHIYQSPVLERAAVEEAIAHYLAAIKINPDHVDAHYNLAEIFVKQNKIDQAIEHFREAVRDRKSVVGKECTSWCRSRWSPYH